MVKVAILGAGFMGQTHGTAYQHIENAELAAVFDQNEALGKTFAEKYGCRSYTDLEALLCDCEIDVVDICLPTFLHETYAILAAKRGKHVFCEKPVTLSVASFDKIFEAVNEAGVQMFVGQVVRFWSEYAAARQLYLEGALGDLCYVYAARLSEHPAWSEWYRRPENSGGGLIDLHLHDIDYLCWLLGTAEEVYAAGTQNALGCWNYVSSILRFESGKSATAEGVIEMAKGYPFTTELRLVGSKQTYEYAMKAGANLENVAAAKRQAVLYGDGRAEVQPLNPRDAYEIELEHFITCIDRGISSNIIQMDGVRNVLCTIEALKCSLETKKAVRVNYGRR